MKPNAALLKIEVQVPQEFNHASYPITGFYNYAKANGIPFCFSYLPKAFKGELLVTNGLVKSRNRIHQKTSYYTFTIKQDSITRKISVAIDLYDLNNSFSQYALANADVVYKRSYNSAVIKHLPKAYQEKLKPFGLTYPVKGEWAKNIKLYRLSVFLSNVMAHWKWDKAILSRWFSIRKDIYKQAEHFEKNILPESSFCPSANTTGKIFYQKRFFEDERDEDTLQIHQNRYELVKVLRNQYQSRFVGGLAKSKLVTAKYSDALSNIATPQEFMQALEECKIAVYTRGLVHSTGWTLAEYMAKEKVIIAERLYNELPEPLIHGQHVLFFSTPQEVIELIKALDDDAHLSRQLSDNARKYFEMYVLPERRAVTIIKDILAAN